MYTVDLSGHDQDGNAGVNRFGGLFLTVDAAVGFGRTAAARSRLHFHPETLWVRDEENNVVRRDKL